MITHFKFLTPLWLYRHPKVLLGLGKDPMYVVGCEYQVSFKMDGEEKTITVHKGLLTDLASVPAIARSLMGRVGRHLEAAIVHDHLYGAMGDRFNRKESDEIFLAGMLAANVPKWRAKAAHRVVRWFGSGSYKGGTNEYFPLDEMVYDAKA